MSFAKAEQLLDLLDGGGGFHLEDIRGLLESEIQAGNASVVGGGRSARRALSAGVGDIVLRVELEFVDPRDEFLFVDWAHEPDAVFEKKLDAVGPRDGFQGAERTGPQGERDERAFRGGGFLQGDEGNAGIVRHETQHIAERGPVEVVKFGRGVAQFFRQGIARAVIGEDLEGWRSRHRNSHGRGLRNPGELLGLGRSPEEREDHQTGGGFQDHAIRMPDFREREAAAPHGSNKSRQERAPRLAGRGIQIAIHG